MNFSFDGSYVRSRPKVLNFTMNSDGAKLLCYKPTAMLSGVTYFLFALSLGGWLLMVLGALVKNMVGIEFMHTLQIIYFTHFSIKNYKP